MTAWLPRGIRAASIAVAFSTVGCGSGSDDGGSGGATGNRNQGTCELALTLSGDSTFQSDLGDPVSCISTVGSGSGAFVAYGPRSTDDVTAVELSLFDLTPMQTGANQRAALGVHRADGSEFAPMGCSVDVTENSFREMDDFATRYHVVGQGTCTDPGVVDTRTISVVGFFRFVATLGWAN